MKKKQILLITIILFLLIITKILIKKQKISKNIEQYTAQTLITEEEKNENIEIGKNSKMTSIQITKTKTGTGPFDKDDEPGNDSSENNSIVRSFDQITWTIEATMALKQSSNQDNYKGGIIEIDAEIPENCKEYAKWDLSSMTWAEDAEILNDGTKFKAKYVMPNQEITVPGKQTLVIVLKLGGAPNKLEIKPKITMNLYGNTEEEKKVIMGENITVSAAPNYNIKILQNKDLQKKMTINYGAGNKIGRMYGYGIILQLYNTDASKGLKGIEYPKGEIKFDINLKLLRSNLGSEELEDITEKSMPILWNYKINNSQKIGNIYERTMYFGNNYHMRLSNAPLGKKSNRIYSVLDSGNINMIQNGRKINTIISNYQFDEIFPKSNYYYEAHPHNTIDYTNNIGCFSVGYFQIFVPDNEENTIENRNYYLSISDENFNATSASGVNTSSQINNDDDICTNQHVIYRKGIYKHAMTIKDENYSHPLSSSHYAGDGYALTGSNITVSCKFGMDISNDKDIYSADKFVKFDGNCVQPEVFSDGKKYKTTSYDGTMEFKVYYVTKKNGENWENQDDMNNGNIENMELYENIEDIPKNKLCVGIFFESQNGYLAASSGDNNEINIPIKVKENAVIGQTYGFTQNTKYWLDELDRTKFSQKILNGYTTYPKTEWNSGNNKYIKTEYNENGEIIEGTHSGGWGYGQTILITGAELSIIKNAISEKNDEIKTNYDFSKNEYDVTYKLIPILNIKPSDNLKDFVIKIQDILPEEISYIGGTCNYGEPEIEENKDGGKILTWYIYNLKSDEYIEPITYNAHLNELIENGNILNSTAIISEVPNKDSEGNKIYKIGNKILEKRKFINSIQVINLSSYSLFKNTQTPVIEVNDKMKYTITCINKTDEQLNDFKLLDILPYNKDSRGTSYSGKYKLEKIKVKQTSIQDSNENNNAKINIYITEEEKARKLVDAKDQSIGKDKIWKKISSEEAINKSITAFAIDGILQEKEKLEVEIYLQTEENNSQDVYVNSATVQTNKETEPMQTSNISIKTVKRAISGIVWEDLNKDGIINKEEKKLAGIKLQLIREDDLPAKDIKNNEIPAVSTDENGKYIFNDIPKGNYKVKIKDFNKDNQEITLKEIGINEEINNKFNEDGITDIIQYLNNINSPIIYKKNVNAGIIYKPIETKQEEKKEEDNIEKYENNKFNLSIDKKINKIIINGETKKIKDPKIQKIEIPNKEIEGFKLEIEYLIEVENTGNIKAKTKIEEIIPEGLEIIKAENWKKEKTNIISNLEIEPGEKKKLFIILKWSGGDENFGIKTNIVKIKEANNDLNIQEENMEDNESKAEVIISIKTGIETKIKVLIIGIISIMIALIILLRKMKIIKRYII